MAIFFNLCFTLHSPCSRLDDGLFIEARHSLKIQSVSRTLCAGSRLLNPMEQMDVDIENCLLSKLTLGEVKEYFSNIIEDVVEEVVEAKKKEIPSGYSGMKVNLAEGIQKNPERYVYGMEGMAQALHCSVRTAHKLKKKGYFKDAIIKVGGKFIIDRVRLLEIAKTISQDNIMNQES